MTVHVHPLYAVYIYISSDQICLYFVYSFFLQLNPMLPYIVIHVYIINVEESVLMPEPLKLSLADKFYTVLGLLGGEISFTHTCMWVIVCS